MTAEELVRCFYQEKERLLQSYCAAPASDSPYAVSSLAQLALTPQQATHLPRVLNAVLTDAFYTILLGLDGAASIGSRQELYQLADEQGNELTGSGAIEAYAYDYFHGEKQTSVQ
jgi:hypothetical protein